jgi:two-component system, cell cycle sensor histidine kinase and response regulator CckA
MPEHPQATLLYVDDDEVNRLAFTWLLQDAGFSVLPAGTGEEALRLAETNPGLIILDVNLPDINGVEVCRRLKAAPATALIPVLLLSGVFVKSTDKALGLEGGADAYLIKPAEPQEVVATIRALLRTRQAEEERTRLLRERAQLADQLRLLLESTGEGIYGLDRDGRCTFTNRAAAELLGYHADDLIGRNMHELTHAKRPDGSAYPESLCPIYQAIQTGRGCRVDSEVFFRRNGTPFSAEYIAHPIVAEDGIRGAVVAFTDISERRNLEEQVRQARKMEAVGQLAGGIAHEFNNLLTIITGNVSLVLDALPREDPDREFLGRVEKAAWRAAELVRQLLGYACQTVLWLRPTDLEIILRNLIEILRHTLDERIILEVRLAPSSWQVKADAAQISQVLMNLCLNARDYMPQGGRLTLETANVTLDEVQARRYAEARPGEYVCLRVRDTGQGIAPEVLPRIFDPFFTTKEPGLGSGLGLSMVFGLIKQHDGWIECRSTLGQGTAFDIYLPRYLAPNAAAPKPKPRATILLADDESLVRDVGRSILERSGYEVLLATDGLTALELYERERSRIDLVILDLTMPRMDGREALRRLRKANPAVRVLLSSGYLGEDLPAADVEGASGFLQKPFLAQGLLQQVSAALDEAGKAATTYQV